MINIFLFKAAQTPESGGTCQMNYSSAVRDAVKNVLADFFPSYPYKGKMAKISPKINKIEIWPKSRPKVIKSQNKSHRDHIWGMFEL